MTDGSPDFTDAHVSLMRAGLAPGVFAQLSGRKTSESSVSLDRHIQAGVDVPALRVGVVAHEASSYATWPELFNPIISELHQRYDASSGPPTFDREADKVKGACFSEKQAVLHTRVCLSRNVSASPKTLNTSFPFAPSISRSDRRNAEYVLSHCFGLFSQALAGKYTPLDQISDAAASDASTAMGLWQLNIDRPLPNSLQAACGAARDWPDGRGVFASEGMDLFALVNSDFMDHVRLCASQVGGNSVAAFQRCCHAVAELNQSLNDIGYEFAKTEEHGYLTTCPSMIGTGLEVCITLRMPHLSPLHGDTGILHVVSHFPGVVCAPAEGMECCWVVYNTCTIGLTEVQIMQTVVDCVTWLVDAEDRYASAPAPLSGDWLTKYAADVAALRAAAVN